MSASRWTAIDRITHMEAEKAATGIRNVPNTLSILDSHFPRFPVLPGVLILGSLGELAAQLLHASGGRSWTMARAQQIRFRHFVQPGDQMEMTVEVKEMSDDRAILTGSVRVDGKLVANARQLHMAPRTTGGVG